MSKYLVRISRPIIDNLKNSIFVIMVNYYITKEKEVNCDEKVILQRACYYKKCCCHYRLKESY